MAASVEEAVAGANRVGYPVLVRPSYVLGGRAMVIAYDEEMVVRYMKEAVEYSQDRPVLIDHFLEDAIEVDVDALSDGEDVVIGGIMQHIEEAGIHSGDSSCVLPAVDIPEHLLERMRRVHVQAGAGVEGRGIDEYSVCHSAGEPNRLRRVGDPLPDEHWQGLRARSQSAGFANRALRFEGDGRAHGKNCGALNDRAQTA